MPLLDPDLCNEHFFIPGVTSGLTIWRLELHLQLPGHDDSMHRTVWMASGADYAKDLLPRLRSHLRPGIILIRITAASNEGVLV